MLTPVALFVVFTLLATAGAAWIAYAERGLRMAAAVALGALLFFAALAALVLWLIRQGMAGP